MSTDPATARDPATEVMASIDTDGAISRLVIADISEDGAWVSIPEAASASLTEWC